MSEGKPVTVVQMTEVALAPDPLEADAILEGEPVAKAAEVARWSDGSETGIWSISPGVVTDTEVEETFVVLSGRATLEHEGETYELGPGSVCVFQAGAETTWRVTETLLKAYVIRAD